MSLILDDHRQYLDDAPRLAAYDRAIRDVVKPGDVVLDLASGSGILGFLACRAGAARVYAVDGSAAIQIGRELARANGLSDRITFIRELSTRATLPERVDVVVCDQMGPMGVEAGLFEYTQDARVRLLKPEGRSIPFAIEIGLAGIESDDFRARLDFWTSRPCGFDISSMHTAAINSVYPVRDWRAERLTADGVVAMVDIATETVPPITGEVVMPVTKAGRLDGIAGWFVAHLAPGITITNRPGAVPRLNRQSAMLPAQQPVDVVPGDSVRVKLHMLPWEAQTSWDVEVCSAGGTVKARSRHSTFIGMLIADERRVAADPDARPSLTSAGLAQRTVLDLCGEGYPLKEIERIVWERHGTVLRSPGAAAAFVHDVVEASCESAGVPPSNR